METLFVIGLIAVIAYYAFYKNPKSNTSNIEFSPQEEAKMPHLSNNDTEKRVSGAIMKVIMAALFVGFLFYGLKQCGKGVTTQSTSPAAIEQDVKYIAFYKAQNLIKAGLKAPSTAEFPNFYKGDNKYMVTRSGNYFKVTSYVDSQNSFGAMLRSNYTVELRYMNDDWEFITVVFDGEKVHP